MQPATPSLYTIMRRYIFAVCCGFCLLLAGSSLSAQSGKTTLLAGYGGIDHEAKLGPAYHLNVRHQLVRQDSTVLAPRVGERRVLAGMELQGELFAQAGGGGTALAGCAADAQNTCARTLDRAFLLGGGLVSRLDLHHERRWGVLYFLPLTAGVYARGFDVQEWPLGSESTTEYSGLSLSGGLGNGAGVELNVGGMVATVEVRAIITRDLGGGRGGSIPISVGLSW